MASQHCHCGKTALKNLSQCPTCHERQTKRHSRLSLSQADGRQPDRKDLTPPPVSAPSPRNTSNPPAKQALNSAFSSEEDHPSLFPASSGFYRDRTPSRPSSKSSTTRAALPTEASPVGSSGAQHRRSGSLAAPAMRQGERERSYSPMAAAFARLNVKDGAEPRGRPGSARSSVDLERRMFGGAA